MTRELEMRMNWLDRGICTCGTLMRRKKKDGFIIIDNAEVECVVGGENNN